MWIERNISQSLRNLSAKTPVVLLVGARKTGKTALLKSVFPDLDHIAVDKPAASMEISDRPQEFIRRFEQCIFDNIQYAPELLRELVRYPQENRRGSLPFIATSTHVSENLNQIMAQFPEAVQVHQLFSLSAEELRATWISSQERVHYCWKGGYPELWAESGLSTGQFFDEYIQEFIERDVRGLVNMKDRIDFQRFLGLCAQASGTALNYADLARSSRVCANTIKAWTAALHTAGIIQLLPPYPGIGRKRIVKAPRLFFSDHGLLCYLLGISSLRDYQAHPRRDMIWRNITFGELSKTGAWVPGSTLFYYRDQNGAEIDFLLEYGKACSCIIARSDAPSPDETGNFRRVKRAFKGRRVSHYAAAATTESTRQKEQGYHVYNPLYQSIQPGS